MIVHIMNASPIVNEYVTLVNKYCNKKEHVFVIGPNGKTCKKVLEAENIIRVRKWYSVKGIVDMIRYMNKADHIIAHGLFSGKTVAFFYFQPWLLRKTNWLIWGGDVYGRRDKKQTFYTRLVDSMKKAISSQFPFITTLVDGDYEMAKKAYNIRGQHLRVVYPSPLLMRAPQNIENDAVESVHGTIKILLGNSATESNQHKEAFKLLEKYKEKNIKIYVPLSYGPEKYADEIEQMGAHIFGKKFVPMRSFMNKDQYTEFLKTIHVGIFNNNRQQAMGNINQLLLLMKKVYIRDDTTMWEYYVKDLKCKMHRVNEICQESFETLITVNKEEALWNKKCIKESRDEDHVLELWKEVFYQMTKGDKK